jgi:hypothetical protein
MALTGFYRSFETLITEISSCSAEQYLNSEGKMAYGVLLSLEVRAQLERLYEEEIAPGRRGRSMTLPSLLADPLWEEFETERIRIIAVTGKERGANTKATRILAERYKVEFDAMRKRIRKSKPR